MANWVEIDYSSATKDDPWTSLGAAQSTENPFIVGGAQDAAANPFMTGGLAQSAPMSAAAQQDPFAPQQDPFDVSILAASTQEAAAAPPDTDAIGLDGVEMDETQETPAEVPMMTLNELTQNPGSFESSHSVASGGGVTPSPDEKPKSEEKIVLSRQDTFKYMQDLQGSDWATKVAAARALKFLAFNADAEYKAGLIKLGFLRTLVAMLNTSVDLTANEHAASCMYSMAREHQDSKLELLRLSSAKRLVQLLSSDSKQLRLNCTAALYALSCAGRLFCREVAMLGPMAHLQVMLEPPIGRGPQDDQMQLFAALLVVNIVHAKGACVPRGSRPELLSALQRAHDDAQEKQARLIIALGIKQVGRMDSRSSRLKDSMKERSASVSKRISLGRRGPNGKETNALALNADCEDRSEETSPEPKGSRRISLSNPLKKRGTNK
mmetsp:Transcript_3881/g.8415  ORF Transcript_3881/g.8415 Transcript_3881/m.8415 type:complete len:437 (-) Transcript_3881:112-1422(-)